MSNECGVSLVYNRFEEEPKMLQPRLVLKQQHGTQHGHRGTRNTTIECSCGFSHSHNMLLCRHLKLLLIVLGLFAAPTFAAAQRNDEPNVIKPTPALRLASVDDLTTVLLVNNDGAGRLGDGLGHGHGRYLSVRPEVGLLTSTARTFIQEGITTEYATQVVGTTLENGRLYAQYLKKSSRVLYEGGNGPSVVTSWVGDTVQSRSYLESHNDLFNADAPNWRDIDDSLDDIASVPFVGNTDFLKPKDASDSTVVVTPLVTKINKISSAFKPVAITEDTARKLAAQKVLPVGDLPTFTVKNHFEPSGYQAIDTDTNAEEEGRSAKVYYQHLMREKQSEQRSQPQQQLLSLPKRVLSTVTYYGFADFTTVVGDSVIVFSPSTAQPSSIMGHVTSIKGMATLRTEDLPVTDSEQVQVQVEVKVSTDTATEETIQVTETVTTTAPELIVATANAIDTTEFVEVVSSSQTTDNLMATATPTLEQTTTQTKSMFSLPTDEEIQKIYASLAQAQAKEKAKEQSQSQSESQSESQSKSSVSIEATETEHSGATTIFIDDDPFANFIEPTRVINSTVTATSTTTQPETTLIEASTSTVKELAEESTTVAATTAQISQFVKEITSENTHDVSCDEVRSQVFLTQVPMQITLEQTVSPTYDIKETTKYYCIQASQVEETTELKTSTTTESEVDSVVESQSEAPQAEDDDETTVNPLEESQTEVSTTTEESPSTEAATETETDADEEDSTTELTETSQDNDQDNDNDNENENEDYDTESGLDEIDVIYKTLYTTYTYLTTFFQGQSTTVSSHTEIVTNVITSEVSSTQEAVSTTSSEISATETDSIQATATVAPSKYIIPDELDSLLHASAHDASETVEHGQETSLLDDAKYTKTFFTTYTYYTTIFADTETEIMSRTEVFTNYVTELATTTTTTEAQTEESSTNEEHIRLVTDVRSSSSSGDQQQQLVRDSVDDQVSSESNTEEILPSATLLLQTSFTTFTFYTTMYVSDVTNVVSRLETVTNIATETVQPTKMLSQEEATLPITYFTTFTYWTKLAKDGEITTISREETISNVIEPTKRAETETETETATVLSSITDNLEKSLDPTPMDSTTTDLSALTTYYTTYTYYTTSYEANNTVTDSRLETITNIISPSSSAVLSSEELPQTSLPADISPSTPSSEESNTSDLIFYDYKHIIDAEGVSTLYFTTKIQASINDEGSRVELTSSTSSLYIDETKKLNLATSSASESLGDSDSISATQRQYKTGLVRLIEGTRIGNSTTTLYQSKVIGTIIENRYAQIIESTSSFLFEKATPSSTISPSVTLDDMIVSTTQAVNLDSPPVVEGSINTETETTTETETETETEHEEHDEDDNNINNSNNARIPFQTKKRTFAPVIRPFASRNRPTFAPKQKTASASSATIITRSDITPTITATPALKSVGRFGSSRRGSSSSSSLSNAPNNPHETSSTSRRLFGRPLKTSSGLNSQLGSTLQASSAISPSRNRFASSFRTSGIQASSSRRLSLSPSYRPSALSSGLSSRPRIKPTAASGSAFGKASTSAVGEETSTEAEQQQLETADEEENNTTENAKRNQNPLLRFRRPLSRPIGFTPAPANSNAASGFTVSPRRNPFAGRAKATTTSTTTTTTTARPKPRSFQRPTISSVQARNRPQNALFPPRGLFQSQQQQQQQKENEQSAANNQNENDADNDSEYEDDDDDEDAAEDDDAQKEESRRRRSNKKVLTHSRVRREADTVNRSRFRFRRPKTALTEEPKIEEINETTSSAPRSKINSRFGSRFQSQTSSTEASSSSAPSGHRSIRPTRPTSPRTQFTLREKDTTIKSITRPSSSNFRRQQPTLRRSGSSSTTSSSRRLKNYTNHNHNAAETTGLRTTGTTRSRNTANGSSRGRSTMRGRNRNEFPNLTDQGSATITVTHIIPAEVTVPVVNGQVTEYKNIVTGKTSLEVLGPNQYTRMLGNNGQTSLYLTREDSSVSPAGVTELTRYLLHDTPTTTVTFTPTTIRGRKTSFSHVLPSTVYSVENVVSTVQPQISANAPLANILLSQLLLGNINLPANQLLGALGQPQPQLGQEPSLPAAPAQPQTEYRTHTSTYVTTIYDGKSTILPITFQGKKILTTVFDTTAQTITATEYSVDTIISTPTQQPQLQPQGVQGQGQVNSLLLQQLLLQQQQQQQQQLQPIPQVLPTTMPQIFLGENLQDLDNPLMDADNNNIDDIIVSDIEADHSVHKSSGRKKSRKSGKSHKRNKQQQQPKQEEEESSVITLYVSGRRPGEFSTILSTVYPQEQSSSLHKRQVQQQTTATAELHGPEDLYEFGASEKMSSYSYLPLDECQGSGCELKSPTASLESIIGDVDLWYAKATKQASRPPMSFSSTASSSSSAAQMITAESDNVTQQAQHFLV